MSDGFELALGRYDGVAILLDEANGQTQSEPVPIKPKPPQITKLTPNSAVRGQTVRLTFEALRPVNASVGASETDLARLAAVLESPDVVITGVTIVTTRDADGRPTGLTVSAFCSVSLDPPQILVCVDHKSQSYPALRDGGHFAVNFLGDGHEDISRRFATTRLDKFDGVAHRLSGHGVPLLDGALAQLECRVVSRHVEGDHTILVGLVEDARNGAGEPLLYYRGKYRRLAETPSGAKS